MHDALAAGIDPEALPPRAPDHLERALLESLGALAGRRVLDLGCGDGELSLALAGRRARVTGIDISPGMVDVARRRARAFMPGAAAEFVVGDATEVPAEDRAFDLITGKWVLHHLDVARAAAELRRLLHPGGAAVFVENQGRNPILRFAREHLAGRYGIPRYGSLDEEPLRDRDFAALARHFAHMEVSYPDFFFFLLLDRQVMRQRSRAFTRFCARLDAAIHARLPRLRPYSFHVVIRLRP